MSTSASKADDGDPVPTRSPTADDGEQDPALLPVYLEEPSWSRGSTFNLPGMQSQSPLFDCWRNGVDSFVDAYALFIQRPCRFTLESIGANETVESFRLSGILYSTEVIDPGIFQPAHRIEANVNGKTLTPTTWDVGTTGRCARVTWTATQPNLSAGQGEFQALSGIAAANALYVSEAVLMVRDLSVTSTQTPVTSSTSREPVDDPPAGASSAPTSETAASSSRLSAGVIVPAVLVPILVITAALAVFLVWRARQRRRARLAPSAAFRADHAETIARGVEGNNEAIRALSPVPSNVNAYVPIDEKRAFF